MNILEIIHILRTFSQVNTFKSFIFFNIRLSYKFSSLYITTFLIDIDYSQKSKIKINYNRSLRFFSNVIKKIILENVRILEKILYIFYSIFFNVGSISIKK